MRGWWGCSPPELGNWHVAELLSFPRPQPSHGMGPRSGGCSETRSGGSRTLLNPWWVGPQDPPHPAPAPRLHPPATRVPPPHRFLLPPRALAGHLPPAARTLGEPWTGGGAPSWPLGLHLTSFVHSLISSSPFPVGRAGLTPGLRALGLWGSWGEASPRAGQQPSPSQGQVVRIWGTRWAGLTRPPAGECLFRGERRGEGCLCRG